MAEIAHELKQPLVIIGGFARRMADKLGSCENLDPETKPECFNIINRELSRLEEMLVGLIGITRRYTLHYEEVDPNRMISEVLKVNEEALRHKSLKLQDNLGQPFGTVYLDPHLFEHVIRNLVINAIEASPEQGDIAIRTSLVEDPKEPESELGAAAEPVFEMEIKNGGAPIPGNNIDKIFEPFYTTKSGGSGIGLTLAQHIVQEHHGSISVQSDEDGTTFTVRIPVKPHASAVKAVSEITAAPQDIGEGESPSCSVRSADHSG
jgi:signal transduction histidine kinase